MGFENAGFTVGYANEVHAPFLDAYQHARGKMGLPKPLHGYFEGSIEDCLSGDEQARLNQITANAKAEGRTVGFIGGPPCPDFSVAGKNRGQHGDNGKLSQTYIDLICGQRPDFFVFENVKGLYRTAKHRTFFDGLKHQLHEAGYLCTERLVNALDYGAPQDRERIILFGIRNPKASDPVCLNWETYMPYQGAVKPSIAKATEIGLPDQPIDIPKKLTVQHWFDLNDVEKHPNAVHQFKPKAGLKKFLSIAEGDDSKKSYKRLHRMRYSPTAAYGNNEVHIHPTLPRRISVAEALAIQSLPKEFELPPKMTLTNMFKTVGNGVPFLAAQGIARTILDYLGSLENEDTQ